MMAWGAAGVSMPHGSTEQWNMFPHLPVSQAQPGDLIVWDSRLAHGNSRNLSSRPRIAFYVMMGPADAHARQAAVESWQTGRCVPWWR